MTYELRGEGVPENRGGGSGIWSRKEQSPLGEVRVIHWSLGDGHYTELSLRGDFPCIFLQGYVECNTVDLFDLYVAEFFKLGTPALLVSVLKATSAKARKEGEDGARLIMRVALGFGQGRTIDD